MSKIRIATALCTLSILINSCLGSRDLKMVSTRSETATQNVVTSEDLPIPTATKSQESVVGVKIVDICPSTRIVPLEKLNIPAQFRLVTLLPTLDKHGDYEAGYYLISPNDVTNHTAIDIIPPTGMINHNYEVSPDGRWVSFLRWPKNDPTTRTLWISSLDGEKQWPVTQFTNQYIHGDWISTNELVIMGPRGTNNLQAFPPSYYYIPLTVINPFTRDEKILPPLPQEYIDRKQDQMYVFKNMNVYDLFRLIDNGSYILFNYGDNKFKTVFTWLNGVDSETVRIFHKDASFLVLVKKPYGFDLSPELNVPEIMQQAEYTKIMSKIALPAKIIPIEVSSLLPHTSSLSLYQHTDIFGPTKWFTFDNERTEIKDYCFEVSWDASPYSSPDGNFIAFSRGYPEYPAGEIIILNLSTGYISTLEGYQLIGWGIQQ